MKVVNISHARRAVALHELPGAQARSASNRSITRASIGTPAAPRVQDPGAAIMTFTVRSLDLILTRRDRPLSGSARRAAAGDGFRRTRIIVLQDPDGFFVALVQPSMLPETSAPASNNVVASNISFVAADAERTARLYEQALGFQARPVTAWNAASLLMDLAGTAGAQERFSMARVPGTFVTISFHEFSGIDRRPLRQPLSGSRHGRAPAPRPRRQGGLRCVEKGRRRGGHRGRRAGDGWLAHPGRAARPEQRDAGDHFRALSRRLAQPR